MRKTQLVKVMRKRLHENMQFPLEELKAFSDDQIIDSYITCSCCGRKHIAGEQLKHVIRSAESYDHFWQLIEGASKMKIGTPEDYELFKSIESMIGSDCTFSECATIMSVSEKKALEVMEMDFSIYMDIEFQLMQTHLRAMGAE